MKNLFKKKRIPDELPEMPDLDRSSNKIRDEDIIKHHINSKYPKKIEHPKQEEEHKEEKQEEEHHTIKTNQSFFNDLQKKLTSEVDDLNKLEKWYTDKFLPSEVVKDMKTYWDSKKEKTIIQILGKDLQEKISTKINILQDLEKQWQHIYFVLAEKEEEIKEKEKDLKKTLKEFIELCKHRKKKK